MKRTLLAVLAGAGLVLSLAPMAQANSFLQITVGATTVSCTTGGPCAAGFTNVSANEITFTGTVNGVSFSNIELLGNQPGGVAAISTDTKTAATNNNATAALVTVSFASNGFSLPAGTPITFNAAQGMDALFSTTALTENFTGWGNAANTLALTGATSVTPACTTLATPGIGTNSCSTTGPLNSFVRVGDFALAGQEIVNLSAGASINAHGSITATGPAAVPEPSSVLLFGTGILILAGRTIRNRKNKK